MKKKIILGELIWYQLACNVLAITVIAICVLTIAARYVWHVEVSTISGWAGTENMATNTAVCLIFLALAHIIHIYGSMQRRNQTDAT